MRRLAVFGFLCLVLLPVAARADEPELADRGDLFPTQQLFVLDVDGDFRVRGEVSQALDMGLVPVPDKYGVYPQVSENKTSVRNLRESTDFRLRLRPILHVSEIGDVRMVVDLLDVQAGQGGNSLLADALTSQWAMPHPGSVGSTLESASVRMLWGQLHLFHLLTVDLGRSPAAWGMGLVENDASHWDANGGDAIDTVTATARLGMGFEVSASLDWPLEGRSVAGAFSPWQEGNDAGDLDDIWQWRLKVKQFSGDRKAGNWFEWGVYNRIRFQDYSSLGSESPYEECRQYPWAPQFSCNELFWRDATVWTPDVWMAGSLALGEGRFLELEAEVAGRYGVLGASRFLTAESSDRTVAGIGGALRAGFAMPRLAVRLEGGGASGDPDSLAFGILDKPVIGEPDAAPGQDAAVLHNGTVTSFALHPNHLVDLILYRRVIGAVTNSWYVKPSVTGALWERGDSYLKLTGSALYAMAFAPESTPGEAAPLGVEADLALEARVTRHALVHLDGGILFPLDGLARGSKLEDPIPWTTRLVLDFSF